MGSKEYHAEQNRKYRQKNKEKLRLRHNERYKSDPEYRDRILANGRKWQSKNKSRVRNYGRKFDKIRRTTQIERRLFNAAKIRAKYKGIEFNISVEDIVIPNNCPYFNVPLTRIFDNGRTDFNPSLDRIENSKGYVKGNVQVISNLANSMKRNASIEQLIEFAKNILRIHDATQ